MHPAKMAARFGISPSTLRNYEANGLIPPAIRAENGYRSYTEEHAAYLACIQAMAPAFSIEITTAVLRLLSEGKLDEALWLVKERELALCEQKRRLETLIADLRSEQSSPKPAGSDERLTLQQASARVKVPKSAIRYWEKAGLLTAERDPDNGYRLFGASDVRLMRLLGVLRNTVYSADTVMLRQAVAQASADDADGQGAMRIATDAMAHMNKLNQAQMRGVSYLYRLIRTTRPGAFGESPAWEQRLEQQDMERDERV
ncbi:MerR family DNA-binding transcriptional regulator [Paenibacillus methanolicus]|uniref:DNA-binding transcriptional MerR regulator n=1 Tax=Paenibacillus methanolicus TaxID=582686 RepID=A0A5S5C5I5_9BACL|nr:MerR family DNA-binding transcriptional regulator [Paenibacillus methanolicus]TYP74685.1 DNA-binding transcriptional MerR regulator [Paenibacillus methanolicus]